MAYDIQLNEDRDLPVRTRHISGPDLVVQRVRTRLKTWRGEWFLDQRRGLPILEWKQQKPLDLGIVRAIVRNTIITAPDVSRIESLSISQADGTISISGAVIVDDISLNIDEELTATNS